MPEGYLVAERMRSVQTALLRKHSPGTWTEYRGSEVAPYATSTCRRCGVQITVIAGMTDAEIDELWPGRCRGEPLDPTPIPTPAPRIGSPAKKAGRANSSMRVRSKSRLATHGGRDRGGSA